MSAMILDGKAVAARIKREIRTEVERLKERGISPGLAVILVGEDPASLIYVRNKERNCQELGISSYLYRLAATINRKELLELIKQLNNDPKINGLLVQLPLPGHLQEEEVISVLAPEKDVDGFHPVNLGRLFRGEEGMVPCTPAGI
ncbi:MAG TPA: bifunctional methylenetetrahydrofolate dehydrogenase/methenyltetrahydrofolate cyclohydrolase, partial [Firmicutes bacterium]|nr:bifunctional methylenetetrahydrofolate dehydrogenase/methenyltetrahydrofolate cyclohydrolase [Bacillota bacterium]